MQLCDLGAGNGLSTVDGAHVLGTGSFEFVAQPHHGGLQLIHLLVPRGLRSLDSRFLVVTGLLEHGPRGRDGLLELGDLVRRIDLCLLHSGFSVNAGGFQFGAKGNYRVLQQRDLSRGCPSSSTGLRFDGVGVHSAHSSSRFRPTLDAHVVAVDRSWRLTVNMARLFIAVWPPDDVISDLTALHRKDQRGVRFVQPENWHITLRFLGDADPNKAVDALRGITFESAHARLGPGVDIFAERALVIPVAGVDVLAQTVREHTTNIGEPPTKRFVGHLTVARVKPNVAMPRTLGALISAEFDVAEIALVQSRLHPDGAVYETLQTWSARPNGYEAN